ncbi:NAD-dependent malic enzyme [Marinithermus hydrothermalis]|uniref:Malolactic enzyme n=1 Tax=Marinithermus hydrothermalis (strain DSM 14884 / JCM 11576 / T1) TaxID=869210 RepID=F2NK27_MARHT|nr:NAD-dependent malic enzyme [Marinithermus hydrothermalis]AEB11998.1 malic protein NAD-binding protein [Marinithermus hydrothermalis DSM 14884]
MPRISRYYDVKRDAQGNRYLEVYISGVLLQRLPLLNKGTAFTKEERELLDLEGLLPPHIATLEEQKERVYRRYRMQVSNLEKHIYLRSLQDRNEVLFYALLEEHLEEMLPIIYTPTVGEAVRAFSHIYRLPRGLAVSTENIDSVEAVLANVPFDDVRLVVATDSSAILGIGDQGFGGMAIAIGKLSIYTVAGGVAPDKTLPVELDVGTDREDHLNDPLYLGVRHKRLRGEAYYRFMDRFVAALRERYPRVIVQWEDLAKDTAFAVLERYRKVVPSFNDDIQGTGAVALAGVLAACRLKGERLQDQTIVVYGAGAGGIGVAWALREGLKREGLSEAEARRRVYVLDSRGLLLEGRAMEAYKRPYAHDPSWLQGWSYAGEAPGLLEVIRNAGATVLLGLSGQAASFNEPVVRAMLANTDRPVIFPLSNPTSAAEALPEDLIRWSEGRAIVATGSPFPPVAYGGRTYAIGQGNNAFIFPGLGFGAVLAHVREITDEMVLAAAYALARFLTPAHLEAGLVYPYIRELREASIKVAAAAIQQALQDGVAEALDLEGRSLEDLEAYVRERFWYPRYLPYVRGVPEKSLQEKR